MMNLFKKKNEKKEIFLTFDFKLPSRNIRILFELASGKIHFPKF